MARNLITVARALAATPMQALESGHAYRSISLSAPVRDGAGLTLGDTLGAVDRGFDLADCRASSPSAMACLTDRERRIIALRFYGNLTQSRIAERTGISQMHVSRVLAGALEKLRVRLSDEGLTFAGLFGCPSDQGRHDVTQLAVWCSGDLW